MIEVEVFPGANNPEARSDGAWYVRLVEDSNHARLMTSEAYDSRSNAERAAMHILEDFPTGIGFRVVT